MNTEHTESILRDFPRIFKAPSFDLRSGLMAFGFECGDGWFDLIYGLCRDLDALCSGLEPESQEQFYVTQVKEKWGTLSFYVSCSPYLPGEEAVMRPRLHFTEPWMGNEFEYAVEAAETASASICEDCGRPGVLRGGGWLRTLCDEHADGKEALARGDMP